MKRENLLTSFLLITILCFNAYYLLQGDIYNTNYSILSQTKYLPLIVFGSSQSIFYFIINYKIKTNKYLNYLTLLFCVLTFIVPYQKNNPMLDNLHIFFGYLAFLFTNICFLENFYFAHLINFKKFVISSIIMYASIAFLYLKFMHVNTLIEVLFFTTIDLILYFSINELKLNKETKINYETE